MGWFRRSWPRLPRRVARFADNDGGATAVEFAMVSIPFLGLLFAIFETAFVFFVTEALESATADAARVIMTGQAYTGAYTSASNFRDQVICPTTGSKLASFITSSNIVVDITTAGSYGATSFGSAVVSKMDYTTTLPSRYCLGTQGDIVVMRVVYPMPVYLTIMSGASLTNFTAVRGGQTNYQAAGDSAASYKHMLMATSVFRNEPFGTQAKATGCT